MKFVFGCGWICNSFFHFVFCCCCLIIALHSLAPRVRQRASTYIVSFYFVYGLIQCIVYAAIECVCLLNGSNTLSVCVCVSDVASGEKQNKTPNRHKKSIFREFSSWWYMDEEGPYPLWLTWIKRMDYNLAPFTIFRARKINWGQIFGTKNVCAEWRCDLIWCWPTWMWQMCHCIHHTIPMGQSFGQILFHLLTMSWQKEIWIEWCTTVIGHRHHFFIIIIYHRQNK